jgi:hypothetical protein
MIAYNYLKHVDPWRNSIEHLRRQNGAVSLQIEFIIRRNLTLIVQTHIYISGRVVGCTDKQCRNQSRKPFQEKLIFASPIHDHTLTCSRYVARNGTKIKTMYFQTGLLHRICNVPEENECGLIGIVRLLLLIWLC